MAANDLQSLQRAAEWLHNADYVLVAAGAGISAAAGLDYTSTDVLAQHFPTMIRYGFRNFYHFIGYHGRYCPDGKTLWSPELKWGYLANQVTLARFKWPAPHEVYAKTLELIRDKNYFVISSNADGLFSRSGFDMNRIFNPQGDYSLLQCLRQCRPDAVWPSAPVLESICATVDPTTMCCASAMLPTCPYCGGRDVFLNVRGGDWFIEDGLHQKEAFVEWLQEACQRQQRNEDVMKKLVILEVGVGFNTPSVLRWPMESLVQNNPHATIVRINLEHPEFKLQSIASRSVGVSMDACEAIRALHELVSTDTESST